MESAELAGGGRLDWFDSGGASAVYRWDRARASYLTHDTLVGCGWAGVSFRWYCGVGGLVVGH